jgi:hypothetical protein
MIDFRSGKDRVKGILGEAYAVRGVRECGGTAG